MTNNPLFWLSLFLGSTLWGGEGIAWRTWDAALAEARQTGKIILVDAVRDGCHYCTDMDEAVFHDPETVLYIERRFVPVKINLSRETMPGGRRVSMTPSFFFFTPDAELIKTVPGSWNREDFRSFLDEVRP